MIKRRIICWNQALAKEIADLEVEMQFAADAEDYDKVSYSIATHVLRADFSLFLSYSHL